MPADQQEEYQPRWRICANCRKVRFLEPFIVIKGRRQALYVTACSQCRRRAARWIDRFLETQAQPAALAEEESRPPATER